MFWRRSLVALAVAASVAGLASAQASGPPSTPVLGEADYIIIGGGAGGLVAADRLSERGASVVLIERGPPATYAHGGRIQPAWLRGHGLARFDVPGLCNEIWRNSTGVACEDVDIMAGCVLGGGTAINAGLFFVPPDHDWDHNFPAGWKAADMAAARRRVFARIPGTDTSSRDGRRYVQEAYGILGAAAKQAGWREVALNARPNDRNRTFGHPVFMFSGGERGGPLATYLVSAKARPNFKLVVNTMARRIVRAGSIASAVEVFETAPGGKTGVYRLKPGGRVVLAAGAFGTPKVLFRSGIGPQDQLEIVRGSALDGPTMIPSAQWIRSPVGRSVTDHTSTELVVSHPAVRAYDFYAAYNNPIPADRDAYLGARSGVLATAAPGLSLMLYDAVAGTDGITRQLQWTVRAEGSQGVSGAGVFTLAQYLGTGVTSRGRIVIQPNLAMKVGVAPYATTAADKAAIIQGVQNMLAAIAAWKPNGTPRITLHKPAPGQSAAAYVNAYSGGRGANHWMGSARLGTDDGTRTNGNSGSVVDLNTKVYGTANIVRISLRDVGVRECGC